MRQHRRYGTGDLVWRLVWTGHSGVVLPSVYLALVMAAGHENVVVVHHDPTRHGTWMQARLRDWRAEEAWRRCSTGGCGRRPLMISPQMNSEAFLAGVLS